MAQVKRMRSGTGNTQFFSNAYVPKSVESSVLLRSRFLGFSSELTRNRGLSFCVKVRSFKVVTSVAATEMTSKVPKIVLRPIEEISGTVKLPGSKYLSNRILLLALGEKDKALKRAIMEGCGGSFPIGKESKDEVQLFLGNAGTAVRPLTAAVTAAGGNASYILDGVPRMRERPIGDLGCWSKVKMSGSISSQYLTALLMAAP